MKNEETGGPILCPECGSKDDCPHLLGVIDQSFLECSGGYAYDRWSEFRSAVEESFSRRLQLNGESSTTWSDNELQELWEISLSEYSETGELVVDGDTLFRLIIEMLEDCGGRQYSGLIDDEGGPGFASAISLFYAQNPRAVFDAALVSLKELLKE